MLSTLGCGAFLFGAALAALIFAPSLLGGLAAGGLEDWLSDRIAGELRIGYAQLAWAKPQVVSDVVLLDPEGREVFAGSVTLPSMFGLLKEEGPLRLDFELTRLDLRRSQGGQVRLLQSLAHQKNGDWRLATSSIRAELAGSRGLRVKLHAEQCLLPPHPSFGPQDELPELELRELELELGLEPRSVRLDAKACLGASPSATLHLESRVEWDESGRWRQVEYALDSDRLQTSELAALCGCRWLDVPFGETLFVNGEGRGDALEGLPVELALSGDAGRLEFAGRWQEGRLSLSEPGRFELEAHLPSAAVTRAWDSLLPNSLQPVYELSEPWRARAREFSWRPGWGDGTTEFGFAHLGGLGELAASLVLEAPPDLALVDRAHGDRLLPGADWTASLSSGPAGIALDLSGQPPPSAGAPLELPSPWEIHLSSTQSPAHFASAARDECLVNMNVHAEGIHAALVDHLRSGEGLYREVFGEQLDLSASISDLTAAERRVELELDSPGGHLELRGALNAQAFVGAGEDAMRASFRLGSITRAGMLRSLLPWFEEIEAEQDAAPVRIALTDFVLPHDGALRTLSARIELELGAVSFEYAPRLRAALELPQGRVRMEDLSLDLAVLEGRLEYEALPIRFGEERAEFNGTLDLPTGELDLEGEVPLAHLSGDQAATLGSSLTMPVRLGGSALEPRMEMQVPLALWRSMLVEGVDGLMKSGTARMLSRAVGLGDDGATRAPVAGGAGAPASAPDAPQPPDSDH